MELLFALIKDIHLSGADIVLACGVVIVWVKLGSISEAVKESKEYISNKLENGISSAVSELGSKVDEMHGYCMAVQEAKKREAIRDLECARLPIRGKQDE